MADSAAIRDRAPFDRSSTNLQNYIGMVIFIFLILALLSERELDMELCSDLRDDACSLLMECYPMNDLVVATLVVEMRTLNLNSYVKC